MLKVDSGTQTSIGAHRVTSVLIYLILIPDTAVADPLVCRLARSDHVQKRGSGATSGPPAKKGRFSRKDDDSDDEETGFRFKRRG